MFWNPGDVDAITDTFVLDKPMRTDDPWLQAVLEADRHGCETWEMYCFTHGLPTRNVGSWLPGQEGPSCLNERCARLANEEWPTLWTRCRGGNWNARRSMECSICVDERRRRHCVLTEGSESMNRHMSDVFADAPFVHPFRAPAYEAQQLRALTFAKLKNRRLLWVLAHDVVKKRDVAMPKDKEELRKE